MTGTNPTSMVLVKRQVSQIVVGETGDTDLDGKSGEEIWQRGGGKRKADERDK